MKKKLSLSPPSARCLSHYMTECFFFDARISEYEKFLLNGVLCLVYR